MITHDDHNDGSDSPYYPRIVLCVPGTWNDRGDLEERLGQGAFRLAENKVVTADGAEPFDMEFRGPDLRMKSAFQASACRVRPSMTPADFAAVLGHRSVIYVLSGSFGRATAAAAASRMIEIGMALLNAGGIAVKCESAGIAHAAARWHELGARLREAGGAPATRSESGEERARAWAPLFDAYVRLPIVDEQDDLYSCGMHLLGAPDAQISLGDFPSGDVLSAHRVLEGFLRRIRTDLVAGAVPLQQTFRGEGTEDRFNAVGGPCVRYAQDEFFWNRWGSIRLRRGQDPV